MDKWMQEIIDQEKLEIAKNMLERKCDVSLIADCTSLPVEKIEELKSSV